MAITSLGILGGGQLGSLLSSAAKKLNIESVIYTNDKDSPAKNYSDQFIYGKFDDENKINEFLDKVDLVTFEFENIPINTLNYLSKKKDVKPKPEVNKIVQNRLSEKIFINSNKIKTTDYCEVKELSNLLNNEKLIPGILKTCTMGYDGKGQIRLNNLNNIQNLKIDFTKNYILEKIIDLKKEISIVLTRFGKDDFQIYEPIENIHKNQILRYSKIPANINDEIKSQAKTWASLIAEKLDHIGTLCVEFFIDKNNNLYVNEIAPRVHNSGHLTINAYNVSQFENHIRAVCGLEKLKLKKINDAEMTNIIGKDILEYRNKIFSKNEFFFDYLKKEVKENRKMGHLTKIKY
tara:strand:- start:703 stop:1749 length:1047 start_codon:yes stop_codon:yes gene_type:complete